MPFEFLTGLEYIWLIIFVILLIIEALTAALTTIWFAIGAIIAFIISLFTENALIQILAFVIVSLAALIATRPLVKKLKQKRVSTNYDRIIGKTGKVTESIDNIQGTGAVFIDGKEWTARSENDEKIDADALVTITRIEGVKVIVTKTEGRSI